MIIAMLFSVLNAVTGFKGGGTDFTCGMGWLIATFYFIRAAGDHYRKMKEE
jgi:hypothetical protein